MGDGRRVGMCMGGWEEDGDVCVCVCLHTCGYKWEVHFAEFRLVCAAK